MTDHRRRKVNANVVGLVSLYCEINLPARTWPYPVLSLNSVRN